MQIRLQQNRDIALAKGSSLICELRTQHAKEALKCYVI